MLLFDNSISIYLTSLLLYHNSVVIWQKGQILKLQKRNLEKVFFPWRNVTFSVFIFRLFATLELVFGPNSAIRFDEKTCFGHRRHRPVSPNWAIYCTLGNFLKPLATTNLPKSPTFLGNFCKGVKSIIFLVKSFLGNFYKHSAIFFWSHCRRRRHYDDTTSDKEKIVLRGRRLRTRVKEMLKNLESGGRSVGRVNKMCSTTKQKPGMEVRQKIK